MKVILNTAGFWIGFHILIAILLIADLGIFRGRTKGIRFRQACLHSAFWIVLALLFNGFIYYVSGPQSALQFFTGYLIEKSLSIDNLFLFLFLFMHFRISEADQHKVLYWGIIGAIIFRISLILTGFVLIERFQWLYYAMGAFLIFTGINFCMQKSSVERDPTKGLGYRFFKKILPVDETAKDGHFFVKKRSGWKATPLFITLLLIETADIVFAIDSIPAIFAMTTDPFIVYTSNIFAILGLRSHYFVLEGSLSKFYYYKWGLAGVLVFVGARILLKNYISISLLASLMVIIAILGITAAASLMRVPKRRT